MKAVFLGLSYCVFFAWAGFRTHDVLELARRNPPSVPQVKVEVSSQKTSRGPEGRWEAPEGALEFSVERRGPDLVLDGNRVFVAASEDEWIEKEPSGKLPCMLVWDPDENVLQYQSYDDSGSLMYVELVRSP